MTGYDGPGFFPDEDDMDDVLWPTAERVRRVLNSDDMRPAFRDRLRHELVEARAELIEAHAELMETGPRPVVDPAPAGLRVVPDLPAVGPRPVTDLPPAGPRPVGAGSGTRRVAPAVRRAPGTRHWGPLAGWAVAAAAVVVAAAVLVVNGPTLGQPRSVRVSVLSNLDGVTSGDPASALRLSFSQPLDHATVTSAMHLTPTAQVRSTWDGDTLTVTPVHGLAPNSAYVLTVDHTVARTVKGAPLAGDLHVLFGTAPAAREPRPGTTVTAPQPLVRTAVAGADDNSEAVVAQDGSLLLTAAQAGPATANQQGLVRVGNGAPTGLAASTSAICVSRSGRSVAYLAGTRIVFANGVGSASSSVPVDVDRGSPLGWIGDAEVTFVSGSRIKAVNRDGRVRTLTDTAVNAGQDALAIAPGGRYAYVRPASGGTGRIVDLLDNEAHQLPGSTGNPAFSADGATVAWFDGSTGTPGLAVAASGGGPVLRVKLPVNPGDQVSDLALSPDGYHFVYSVTTAGHQAELRLAALPDGHTVAVSGGATGQSPNWSTSGRMLTVLTSAAGASHVDTVAVPDSAGDRQAALTGLATAFANAEISADSGAQRALAAPDTVLPVLPRLTRAAVLWVQPQSGGATVRVRLTVDPRPDQPVAQEAEETLTLGPRPSDGTLVVRSLGIEDFHPAPDAPQVLHVDTQSSPGSVLVSFNSDLDPESIPESVGLSFPDGRAVPTTASYDAGTRTVTLRSAPGVTSAVVHVGTGLRDVRGHGPATGLSIPVNLGA